VRPAAARAPHYRRLRAAAASNPCCRPHALGPPARFAAAARAPRRGRRPHAPLPPARPVGRTLRGRPCVPWPPARPAAARTPRSRPHAPPRGRPCTPRPPPARPAADAAHTPRCRLRALQSAARSAAARAPLGRAPLCRPHATRPQPVRTVANATRMPRGRPCAPRPNARFAAAFAPRGFDRPQASRARLPPAHRRRTRFDCLPCIQTMTGLRLPPLLETSPRGAAACCAPTGSLHAAWRGSRVGGERFHVYNHERQQRAGTRRKHLAVKPPIPPPTRTPSLGRVSRRQTRGRTGRQAFPRAFPFSIRAPIRAATDPGTREDARAHVGGGGAEPEGGARQAGRNRLLPSSKDRRGGYPEAMTRP
jgi:hypothetical protein